MRKNITKYLILICIGLIALLAYAIFNVVNMESADRNAILKLYRTEKEFVKVSENKQQELYATKGDRAAERLIAVMEQNGWDFVIHEGAGYFFEKNGKKIIITTQSWHSRYSLLRVPKGVVNLEM